MSKRKVILRADGNQKIGMGHFVRTLALGEMLKNDFYCVYATQKPTDYQKREVNDVCKEIIELPDNLSHFIQFLDYLEGNEIVVLDNYYFDTDYQQEIKNKGCKLVCIDDMHDKHYLADVVINHAEGLNENDFSREGYTKLFRGLNYALLRSPFFETRDHLQQKDIDLLIGIGGTDSMDDYKKVVFEILELKSRFRIGVIIANSKRGEINKRATTNMQIFNDLTASEIADLMNRSSFGLFPSSTMAIEAIATRLPFATGYFIENQKYIYDGIIKNEIGIPLDSFINLNKKEIHSIMSQMINNNDNKNEMIKNSIRFLDKNSPTRLKKVFKELASN